MTPTGQRRGVVVGAAVQSLGLAGAVEAAAAVERSGFGSLWTVEGRGFEAFSFLGAVGQRCPGMDLGTGIVPAPLRPPTLAAMAASTLQAAGGRGQVAGGEVGGGKTVWLGIGTSTPIVAGDWHGAVYGPRPVARLREYVEVVRRAMSGDRVTFDGEFYSAHRFRMEPSICCDPTPRIVLAALNPVMLATAGEIADGVLLNAVARSAAEQTVARAAEAGNTTVFSFVHVGPPARAEGLEMARRSIASEIRSSAYARAFTAAGYGAVVDQVRARQAGDRSGPPPAAVPDEMCDDFYCFGHSEQVGEFIEGYEQAGLVPVVMPELPAPATRADLDAVLRAAAPRLPAPSGNETVAPRLASPPGDEATTPGNPPPALGS